MSHKSTIKSSLTKRMAILLRIIAIGKCRPYIYIHPPLHAIRVGPMNELVFDPVFAHSGPALDGR